MARERPCAQRKLESPFDEFGLPAHATCGRLAFSWVELLGSRFLGRGVRMPTASGDLDSFGDRGPLLRWLVFTGLWIFAFFLLWRFGLVRQMIAGDRTYLS